ASRPTRSRRSAATSRWGALDNPRRWRPPTSTSPATTPLTSRARPSTSTAARSSGVERPGRLALVALFCLFRRRLQDGVARRFRLQRLELCRFLLGGVDDLLGQSVVVRLAAV